MGYLSCKAESSISTSDPHEKQKPIKIQEFNYKDLELATNNFSKTNLLGRGSHGLVYKGVFNSGRQVAIKRPSRTTPISQNPNEFDNEIEILSSLYSPSLVNLIGFTKKNDTHSQEPLLVVEFMTNGTLYDLMHSNSRPPNWRMRIKLSLQTANVIDLLHSLSPPVIHRDVKSANILIDKNFNARLGDFGLALRCIDDCRLRPTAPAGTMGYLDPCYITPDNLSTKNDVFSFGVLLLEIISGRKAIDVMHSPCSIVDWAIPLIRRGKLLSVYDPRVAPPKDCSVRKMLALVAAKCVRTCKERRPSMNEVVGWLNGLSKLVKVNYWNEYGNPCLMVDVNLMDKDSVSIRGHLRNTRKVYSDLGTRRNLMDLMNDGDVESKFSVEDDKLEVKMGSRRRVLSFRLESGRFIGKTNIRSTVVVNSCR